MANKLIHIRMPDILYKRARQITKENGYRNVQDFTLESLRNAVQEHCRREALKALDEGFGKYKGKIKRMTSEERDKFAREFMADKNRSNILRKYGLDKV